MAARGDGHDYNDQALAKSHCAIIRPRDGSGVIDVECRDQPVREPTPARALREPTTLPSVGHLDLTPTVRAQVLGQRGALEDVVERDFEELRDAERDRGAHFGSSFNGRSD